MFYDFVSQNIYYICQNVQNEGFRSCIEEKYNLNSHLYYFHQQNQTYAKSPFQNEDILSIETLKQTNQDNGNNTNNSIFHHHQLNQVQIENNKLETYKLSLKQCYKNKQKFGRNIPSNIFHLMAKYVSMNKKLYQKIEKIIQTHNLTIKANQFYRMIKKMKSKLPAYATNAQIRQFLQGKHQETQENDSKNQECSKIFRILCAIYLENHHMPYVYNSNKIKKESKKLHIAAIRKIYEIMG